MMPTIPPRRRGALQQERGRQRQGDEGGLEREEERKEGGFVIICRFSVVSMNVQGLSMRRPLGCAITLPGFLWPGGEFTQPIEATFVTIPVYVCMPAEPNEVLFRPHKLTFLFPLCALPTFPRQL